MNLIDGPSVAAADRPQPGSASGPCPAIAAALGTDGWCVTPDFLPAGLVRQLRAEVLALWEEGEFRRAGVGRGARLQVRPSVRTDWVHWLAPGQMSALQQECLARLESVRATLNRELQLGLFEYEGHLALYPPGARYHKHLDQFLDMGTRTVSCVLYLNPDWHAADGGQLRIYTDPDHAERYDDILPQGGTLVTFLSARFLHEVLPATRARISLSGWLKRRA